MSEEKTALRALCLAARIILENGGETYRAEETMNRAALSLGAVVSESFVTPTVVMLSVQDNDKKTETIIHRVKKREINLGKIGSINALSRRISSRAECLGRAECPGRTECPGKAGFYNVGPDDSDCVTTGNLVDLFCKNWGDGLSWTHPQENQKKEPHEANYLKLDCSRIKHLFGWKPVWNIETAIEKTVEWAKEYKNGSDLEQCMNRQIEVFFEHCTDLL